MWMMPPSGYTGLEGFRAPPVICHPYWLSSSDELGVRVRALELQVASLREGTLATRTLAGLADRDVGELRAAVRAQTETLNALRETQLEQARTLSTLANAIGGLVTTQGEQAQVLSDVAATVRRLAGEA
jgi:hypothetical protein